MKINIIIYSVLISVICVLLGVVQYYYLNAKRLTAVKPYFRELILTTPSNYYIQYDADILPDNIIKTKKVPTANDLEVERCLEAALTYQRTGKVEKALKLFEHAASLAPNNPDVLNEYGLFMEEQHKDIILADELYFKALTYSPDHDGALSNRKRTAHLVDQLDLIMFHHLDEKRDLLMANIDATNFETKKLIFYLHIYHTVGIEGNTMTINQLKYLLETGRAVGGKSIMEHNEILGLELALQYVKMLSTTHYIGIDDILEIHKRVMGHVDPLGAGGFRNQQVYVGSHIPPPPEHLARLMNAYVEWLNSEEVTNMHPVRLAALAHYKLVDIHPFSDGNGRTSRLIMNLILLRTGYPPIIIYKEDRQNYYEYLNVANTGDVRPFVRFIAYCTDETLNTYLGQSKKLEGVTQKLEVSSPVIEIDGIRDL